MKRPAAYRSAVAAGAVIFMTLSACGSAAETDAEPGAADTAAKTVTLITHDSFAISPEVLDAFQSESGIELRILAQGDAGEVLSQAIVTSGNPLGDVLFGIDNTLATKALGADILDPYVSSVATGGADRFAIDDRLTAIDFGDVCVNVDHEFYAEAGTPEPQTFEDLAKPEYRDQLVAPDAGTSSPGLAFLFGTIAHFGEDGYLDYWQQLKANGVKITGGWTEAYTVDFSGAAESGDRPLVVSYASSPPSEVHDGVARTGALLDTCFRQVEYAGVLAGAANPDGAKKVIDFLLSDAFQSDIPGQMYMYPVDRDTALPEDWQQYAPVAENPAELDPALIDANRQSWLDAWADLVQS